MYSPVQTERTGVARARKPRPARMDLVVVILVVVVEMREWVGRTGGDATARASWFYRGTSRRRTTQISLWGTLGCHSATSNPFGGTLTPSHESSGREFAKGRYTTMKRGTMRESALIEEDSFDGWSLSFQGTNMGGKVEELTTPRFGGRLPLTSAKRPNDETSAQSHGRWTFLLLLSREPTTETQGIVAAIVFLPLSTLLFRLCSNLSCL